MWVEGIVVGKRKCHILACANDLAVVETIKNEMKNLESLRNTSQKKLTINTHKNQNCGWKKGGGRVNEDMWK